MGLWIKEGSSGQRGKKRNGSTNQREVFGPKSNKRNEVTTLTSRLRGEWGSCIKKELALDPCDCTG
ncbi:hypothetical protein SESBI_05116 [Sesbania bispinosa]|nr:hypothetical protein SESBI_05116 [Sesbania bispinosa]